MCDTIEILWNIIFSYGYNCYNNLDKIKSILQKYDDIHIEWTSEAMLRYNEMIKLNGSYNFMQHGIIPNRCYNPTIYDLMSIAFYAGKLCNEVMNTQSRHYYELHHLNVYTSYISYYVSNKINKQLFTLSPIILDIEKLKFNNLIDLSGIH